MKKLITVSLTGIGLIAIALAIYYKKGNCSHYPIPCYSDRCSIPDPSKRLLFHPRQKEEACKLINSDFTLNIEDTLNYQTYYISLEKNKNFVVSARVHETVEVKGEKKIKSLKFLLLNSEDSYYYISEVEQPKREGVLYIDLWFKKGKCNSPFISKEYTYVIKKPEHYIEQGDTITHHHKEDELNNLCGETNGQKKLRVGGHLCQISVSRQSQFK